MVHVGIAKNIVPSSKQRVLSSDDESDDDPANFKDLYDFRSSHVYGQTGSLDGSADYMLYDYKCQPSIPLVGLGQYGKEPAIMIPKLDLRVAVARKRRKMEREMQVPWLPDYPNQSNFAYVTQSWCPDSLDSPDSLHSPVARKRDESDACAMS